jgi:hypothetical protein
MLLRKHSSKRIRDGVGHLYDEPTLATIRQLLGTCLAETSPPDLVPDDAVIRSSNVLPSQSA